MAKKHDWGASVLLGVVEGKRALVNEEYIYWDNLFCLEIIEALLTPEDIEAKLLSIRDKYIVWQNQGSWTEAIITAVQKRYGDPSMLYKDPLKLKPYAVPYWNPTGHKLNIASLGILDGLATECRHVETVEPGQMVGIPRAYTIGGKQSAVFGVAPQLIPLIPKGAVWGEHKDFMLDLHPNTYLEWVTFFTSDCISTCCAADMIWSEALGKLVCYACRL